jgi:hypothetical protein
MRKNSGLKNEKQVQKILVSGSAVLQEKNSAGIRIVRAKKEKPNAPYIKGYPDLSEIPTDNYGNLSEAGILTNDKIDGGIIGGKLIRPKYDRDELEKSIDTDIFELIPNEPVELPDTVLRSIYDEATNNISTLTTTIETLNSEVLQLTSKVSELEVVSESLKIQADSEILKASTLEIQNGIINLKISETTIDLQNAIQNSINEAIQRVSLTARTEALTLENQSLRDQVYGLSAATAAGGTVGSSSNFAVVVIGSEESQWDMKDTTSKKRIKNNSNWRDKCKIAIDVKNISSTLTITKIEFKKVSGTKMYAAYSELANKTVAPESTVNFKLKFDDKVKDLDPPRGGAEDYNSQYKVEVTFDDGTKDNVQLSGRLRKNKG